MPKNETPKGDEPKPKVEEEIKDTPPTQQGKQEEEKPPKNPPTPSVLSDEEQKELDEYRKIKEKTGFTTFRNSADEAIRLKNLNINLEGKLEQSGATLSEADLLKLNPDYEFMDEGEKKEFKEKIAMTRRMAVLEAKEKMRQDYAALPEDLKKKIVAKGGYEVFTDYACSPENAGQKSLENLAKSFLYDEAPPEVPPETPPANRPGLEEESGGGESTPTPSPFTEMTAPQVAELRTRDPQKYAELIKTKKLKIIG